MSAIVMSNSKYTVRSMIEGQAKFEFYRDGNLYHRTANGVIFAIPIIDTGTATFPAECKGITLMRWIRKFLESLNEANDAFASTPHPSAYYDDEGRQ